MASKTDTDAMKAKETDEKIRKSRLKKAQDDADLRRYRERETLLGARYNRRRAKDEREYIKSGWEGLADRVEARERGAKKGHKYEASQIYSGKTDMIDERKKMLGAKQAKLIMGTGYGDRTSDTGYRTGDGFKNGGAVKAKAKAKPVWDKERPKDLGKPKALSPAQKAKAKSTAKAAGRPYPNLVDNMRAAKGKSK
jgi:hypothetical protein